MPELHDVLVRLMDAGTITPRPVAPLVPRRDDELVEIDDVVGMQVRQQQRVEPAPRHAGGHEALGHAGAAVDQHLRVGPQDYLRRLLLDSRLVGSDAVSAREELATLTAALGL
mgnify:CR=1 FL=1